MATIQREVRKRGFMGKLVKYAFIAFNLIMIAMVYITFKSVGEVAGANPDDAAKAGAALGGVMAFSVILWLWVLGDIVLGLLVLLSRGPRMLITEERP